MGSGRFKSYAKDIQISVDGQELRLKRAEAKKVQELMNLTKDEDNLFVNLVEYFTEAISGNYPDEPREEVEAFVQANALTIFEEFQIAYGLIKRTDLEKRKSELIEKAVKK